MAQSYLSYAQVAARSSNASIAWRLTAVRVDRAFISWRWSRAANGPPQSATTVVLGPPGGGSAHVTSLCMEDVSGIFRRVWPGSGLPLAKKKRAASHARCGIRCNIRRGDGAVRRPALFLRREPRNGRKRGRKGVLLGWRGDEARPIRSETLHRSARAQQGEIRLNLVLASEQQFSFPLLISGIHHQS
jgi:hypothetical protein